MLRAVGLDRYRPPRASLGQVESKLTRVLEQSACLLAKALDYVTSGMPFPLLGLCYLISQMTKGT